MDRTEMRPDVGAPRRPVVAAVEGTDGRRREWGGAQDLGWKVLALVQVSDDGGLDRMEAEAEAESGLLVFLLYPPPHHFPPAISNNIASASFSFFKFKKF